MAKFPKLVECSSLPVTVTEEAAREIDARVKEIPADMRAVKRKTVSDPARTEINERCDISYVSTPTPDHEKECVLSGGLDLSVYEKNRIVLFGHDQSQICGKCLWIKDDDGKGVLAKTYYPPRPDKYTEDWLPERVWGLVASEILRGKSITFVPVEMQDPDEHQKAAGAEIVFSKSLLLEYSVVALPCCPDALVQAVEKQLDLELMGIQKTGRFVKARTKRTEIIDRTPQFLRAVSGLMIDPDAIALRVIEALKNRGRV